MTDLGTTLLEQLGAIVPHAAATGAQALLGLIIGSIVAIAVAAALVWIPAVRGAFAPLVAALVIIPLIVLTPGVADAIGGPGETGRVLIAATAAFVPVYLGMLRGLRQPLQAQREVFAAASASRGQRLAKLTLPAALPHLLAGVRVASTLAVVAAIAADWLVGASSGLGAAIASSVARDQPTQAWAGVIAACAIALVLLLLSMLLERGARRYRKDRS